jgi:hypothetical protein
MYGRYLSGRKRNKAEAIKIAWAHLATASMHYLITSNIFSEQKVLVRLSLNTPLHGRQSFVLSGNEKTRAFATGF